MYYLIIALTIVGIILSISYGANTNKPDKRGNQPERKFSFFINFVLSLLSVFTGAFLAFQLSDYQANQSEKNNVENLLKRATIELEDESDSMTVIFDYLNSKTSGEAEIRLNANPLQNLYSLNILLNNEAFSKYVSDLDAMLVQSFTRQADKVRGFINTATYPLHDRIEGIKTYSEILSDLKLVLSLESDYIGGKISASDLRSKLHEANFIDTNPPDTFLPSGPVMNFPHFP